MLFPPDIQVETVVHFLKNNPKAEKAQPPMTRSFRITLVATVSPFPGKGK